MRIIISFILSAIAIFVAAYLTPGVVIDSFVSALVVAIVLGLLNSFVKPVLLILTLPINIVTLGLFTIVINLFILYLADYLVAGFAIGSILSALLFGIVLTLINMIIPSDGV